MSNREKVGKISLDLAKKSSDNTHSAHEQMQEQLNEYDYNLYICVEGAKNQMHQDFFVVVTTKKERLMQNVIRNYFFARKTCPTPEWDQTVYRYSKSDDHLEFLWVIPAKDICEYIIRNALRVAEEERELLNFVLDFNDGTLFRLAKKLNKEEDNSPYLIA